MAAIDVSSAAWFLTVGSRRIGLPDGEHVVGRSRECDVVVRDATVSRAHVLIGVDGGRVTLQDLGSSNGTRVNGERVREETALAAGDQVRLGRVRMTLLAGAAEPFGGAASPLDATGATACPACGALAAPDAPACPGCGEPLASRPLSRSEAVAMSEVMAVGERLARPARSLDETLPPFPAAWQPPGDGEAAAGEGGGERDQVATVSADDTAARAELPVAALDASSPVAVARAAEEDSPPPRPPGAAADEPADDAGEPAWPGAGAAGVAEWAQAPLFLPAAGFWARAAAFAIDLAGPLALALVVGFAVSGWTPASGLAAGVATGLLAWLALSVPGWRRRGDSPGKRLLGLRVCDLDGRPGIGGRRALLRFAGYVAGLLTLGVGFLLAGLTAGRRGLHDHLAGSYVGRVERGRLL